MRHSRTVALSLLAVLILTVTVVNTAFAQETTAEATEAPAETTPEATEDAAGEATPESGLQTYVVQPGDNLYRIALRFGTTTAALAAENGITNPQLILVGQVLRIPGTQQPDPATPVATPTPAPPPSGAVYVVQPGDNLYRIAVANGTTIAQLVAANNIANPNIIYVGQSIVIPTGDSAPDGDTPTATSPTTAAPDGGGDFTGDAGFAYGVEAFLIGQDVNALADQVTQLGMEWVKVRVDWSQLEPAQGQIIFTEVDNVVNTLESNGLGILFTVTNAPSWARTSVDENGPPDDLQTYFDFVGELAARYSGRVGAYEIWDEPNLRRNWNCDNTICETEYIDMLSGAYEAIKAADSSAQVISAGLAPTGFNDGINAYDDRLFLQGLYADGLADVSDAVGAHPGGWANPPAALCCEQPQGVETHFESERFYFMETLSAYRSIMVNAGDADTAIWVTKFGWGSSEDTEAPSSINIFVSYTSLSEQAVYVSQAFELGAELSYVGPMFLDNLNGCQGLASRVEVCYTALIGPDGAPRPVFSAVQAIDKGTGMMDTTAPEPTQDTTVAPTEESAPVENTETMAPEATEESMPLPPDEEVPEGQESGTGG